MLPIPTPSGAGTDSAEALRRRAEDVAKAARALLRCGEDDPGADAVHRLRVTSRRALVALDHSGLAGDDRARRSLRRRVRSLRRAAGLVRDCDVHGAVLKDLMTRPGSPCGVAESLERIAVDRRVALDGLRNALRTHRPALIRRSARRACEAIRRLEPTDQPRGLVPELEAREARTAARLEVAAAADLCIPAQLHELRLSVKALRYALELRAPSGGIAREAIDRSLLAQAQSRLGEVNDLATLVDRLGAYARSAPEMLTAERERLCVLHDRFAAVLAARCESAAAWWNELVATRGAHTSLAEFLSQSSVGPSDDPAETPSMQTSPIPPADVEAAPTGPAQHLNGRRSPAPREPQGNLWIAGLRLGVIDVGSNSIRLLAVEMIDDREWRVLGEERAMTRLAHGLARDGVLHVDAMARSVEAVGRFKAIAESLGVKSVRAFATAAVREAENGPDFVSLVTDRTGLTLEIISAAEEGRLTYRSVARAHDISHGTAAVVDIGGGSMEVVFSDSGVITRNVSMKLGALRLTEQFGGADACATRRFAEMRRFVRRTIARRVPRPEVPPAVLAGCGGTFTTLLTLAAAARGVILDRNSPALSLLGPVSREQVRVIIRSLRSMSLEQRLRVPGLPSDRSDIVLAGLVAIERLMKHLGCSQLVAHPGGVREGLLLRLVDEHVTARVHPVECLESRLEDEVRSLGRRCRVNLAHAEHVTALALSLYDQFRAESDMIPGLGAEPEERGLLAAAALLHDAGVMVEYRRHHKHSAGIIRQTGLPGASARHIELIAQVARYHRRATPTPRHKAFAALPDAERELVTRLAAILRVADGLDRPHAQTARAAVLRFSHERVHIDVSGEGDLAAEIKGARRKSGLLKRVLKMPVEIVPAGTTACDRGERCC